MSRNLINRLLPSTDRDKWSADKWRRHLLSRAESQMERDDINAMFRGC
jgi:hypothetical protein